MLQNFITITYTLQGFPTFDTN